ncbi:hypothetical protein N9242_03595 [Vicingaceae bacterium]|nr:hypothetical protein [Vicingaceae bacterium]
MIESKFQEAAEFTFGNYRYYEKQSKGIIYSTFSIIFHTLEFNYKGNLIKVEYEFGNHNMASISTSVKSVNYNYDFKIKKRGHLMRLFNKTLKSLRVLTPKHFEKTKIESLLLNSGLEEIANDTTFKPTILFKRVDNNNIEITTQFYLGFENKEEAILPIARFYKGLIDLIKD